MDLIGKKVKQNKFGEGVITQQDASYVSVKFVTEADPKKFMYPTCFKNLPEAVGCGSSCTNRCHRRLQEEERIDS